MHFGWNIGKAFGKKRIHTVTFFKNLFAYALRDIEISTIERKRQDIFKEAKDVILKDGTKLKIDIFAKIHKHIREQMNTRNPRSSCSL